MSVTDAQDISHHAGGCNTSAEVVHDLGRPEWGKDPNSRATLIIEKADNS